MQQINMQQVDRLLKSQSKWEDFQVIEDADP